MDSKALSTAMSPATKCTLVSRQNSSYFLRQQCHHTGTQYSYCLRLDARDVGGGQCTLLAIESSVYNFICSLINNSVYVIHKWLIDLLFCCSNLGFALLGNALAEKLTNMTFQMYVEEKIIKPLGLKNTGFEFTDR